MSGIEPEDRSEPTSRAPWSPDDGPEPAWAEAIRRGRKARGDRLREVFGRFGDEDPAAAGRSRPANDEGGRS